MNVTPLASTAFRSNGDYQTWIEREEPVTWARETRSEGRTEPGGPLISVVLPCRDPSPTHITALLDSMAAQTYGHWQLCVADASPGPEVSRLLRAKAQDDGRVGYSGLPAGAGAAGLMNHAIDMAQGEWLGLIGQHDTLSPHALAEVVGALDRQTPPPDVLYSDEDAISADGTRRLLPFFKPDWSPELSFNADYASRLVIL